MHAHNRTVIEGFAAFDHCSRMLTSPVAISLSCFVRESAYHACVTISGAVPLRAASRPARASTEPSPWTSSIKLPVSSQIWRRASLYPSIRRTSGAIFDWSRSSASAISRLVLGLGLNWVTAMRGRIAWKWLTMRAYPVHADLLPQQPAAPMRAPHLRPPAYTIRPYAAAAVVIY